MSCFWHEPESHLSDDAEIALAEDTIDGGTIGVLKRGPCCVVAAVWAGEGAHSCAEEGTVWENDFHAAAVGEVVAIGSISIILALVFYDPFL